MTRELKNHQIFMEDELKILSVPEDYNLEDLLSTNGLFYLRDLEKPLNCSSNVFKKKAWDIQKLGGSPWKEIGIKKIFTQWIVRMKVFGPYFRENFSPPLSPVLRHWDTNQMLEEKGLFSLSEVCRFLPLRAHQLRYQAKKHPQHKALMGIWKDEKTKKYVVDMEIFSRWLIDFWLRTGKEEMAQL